MRVQLYIFIREMCSSKTKLPFPSLPDYKTSVLLVFSHPGKRTLFNWHLTTPVELICWIMFLSVNIS